MVVRQVGWFRDGFQFSAIPSLANLSSLRFARPAMAVANVGSVTSQGDIALKSNLARSTYGLTGAGVTVGILLGLV